MDDALEDGEDTVSSIHEALREQADRAREKLGKRGVLSRHDFFSKLKAESIEHLIQVMQMKLYTAGNVLCKQKDEADCLFILISGGVYVDIENDTTGEITRVNTIEATPDKTPILGESSIIDQGVNYRSATLTASCDVQTMEIHKQQYFILHDNGDLMDEGQDEGEDHVSSLHKALRRQANNARTNFRKENVLKNHPFFSKLKPGSIDKLLDVMEFRMYQPGVLLCSQNEIADRLFVMVSGEVYVDIMNEQTGCIERVNTIVGESIIFGESSVMDEGVNYRTASLISKIETQTMEIHKTDYFRLEKNVRSNQVN